jgi:hypothetical protein
VKYAEQADVTLEMIINAGILQPGTKLYAASDNKVTSTLNVDGSVTLELNGEEKIYPYPSGAARAVRNISVSGWVFWRVMEDGRFIELTEFKHRYLKSK